MEQITRAALAELAAAAGEFSLTACALRFYDDIKGEGRDVEIHQFLNVTMLRTESGSFHYG